MAKAKARDLDQSWVNIRENNDINVLSTKTGITSSTLYRKLSPTDADVRPKDSEIAPICNASRDYNPLEIICNACGGVFLRLSRGRKRSAPEPADYQIRFNKMFTSLLEFEKNPTENNATKFIGEARMHTQETVALQKKVESHTDQIDMDLDFDE